MSGGWAIDLFLGEVTRDHEDLEITVFRHDQRALRKHFAGRPLFCSRAPGGWVPWEEDEWLALPVHQILVRPEGSEPPGKDWDPTPDEIQFFLNEVEDDVWRSRRDPKRVTRPVEEFGVRSASGIPIVAPEIQLLYKAKWHRENDEHDFRVAGPLLKPEQRAWLKEALTAVHPQDPWLQEL